ncbi:MAG: ADP-ribosylglycohydrolase family protein [Oscillospiraceae bacterium]|nr:ADP-ribosylglycohydrolase family protein [Oscillospiraceae bacterium]
MENTLPLTDMENRIMGGLFGLLVGDALGVPYEFHPAAYIPPIEQIEMEPPAGFRRSHSEVKAGTWSDDGAQALCLLDSLLENGRFSLSDFSCKLLAWYEDGLWAVDNYVFDIGVQTAEALSAFRAGTAPEKCGNVRPNGKGNGALMRVLPLALWHTGSDEMLVSDAHAQCLITHGNITNQVCCALYCLTARELLNGISFDEALSDAVSKLRCIYSDKEEYPEEFESSLRPDEPDIWTGRGGGYVIDSLRSAFMIMKEAKSYEEAVKKAIALGDDTDTTACIAGGLAGIAFGFDSIPERWIDGLRQKEDAEGLLSLLLAHRRIS